MGKVSAASQNAFSGKVGNLVGATWKGIPYIRTRPDVSNRKLSDGQKKQCTKFGLAVKLARTLLPYIRVGYRTESEGKTQFNAAISYISKYGITGVAPDFAIDYPSVYVSRGALLPAEGAQVEREGRQIVFAWTDNSGDCDAAPTDVALPMVLNTVKQQAVYATEGATRADQGVVLEVPASWATDACVAYLGFAAADGGEVSNSEFFNL